MIRFHGCTPYVIRLLLALEILMNLIMKEDLTRFFNAPYAPEARVR